MTVAWVWYLDRGSALVAYATLYLAVVSGVFYEAREFGRLARISRRYHVRVATLATMLFLFHGTVGVVDAGLVVTGRVPPPAYPTWYFVAGAFVGVGAAILLVVAVLGFVDARRFERPWTPRVVHAFAYGGFAFATVHMFAVGSDVDATARLVALVATALLAVGIFLRALVEYGVVVPATVADAHEE